MGDERKLAKKKASTGWCHPGVTKRWQPAAVSVVSGNLVFRPS
jgi:hypothetical protein